MYVFMTQIDAAELHNYLQGLINQWPDSPERWTPEQHRVSRAFMDLEGSLWRQGLLPESSKDHA